MEAVEVTLPTGLALDDGWFRSAGLRSLSGVDEEAICQVARTLYPAERVTHLLSRCLTHLGPKSDVGPDDVRSLVVGDREALLLQLRRIMFGDRIRSWLICRNGNCEERMDLDVSIGEILVPPNLKAQKVYEAIFGGNGADYSVEFRLATGADQEAIAQMAGNDPTSASMQLLKRCILKVQKDGIDANFRDNLPAFLAKFLSGRMADLDPQAEILFDLTCPSCGNNFQINFDIADFFFRELIADSEQLYKEVHLLALHYHWRESDILGMGRSKRHIYLRLLADALNPEENQ